MRIYWDSSALLNALASKPVVERLKGDEHFTRSHAYAEVFSHLTGRGLPMKTGARQRVSNEDAAKMLLDLSKHLRTRDLTEKETLDTIELSRRRGVEGARIHDLLHARTAALIRADTILTRDLSFSSLGENIVCQWP